MLIVVALVLWGLSEGVDLLRRTRSRQSLASHTRRSPWWIAVLNVVALVLACVGFVLWLAQDQRNFGIGL